MAEEETIMSTSALELCLGSPQFSKQKPSGVFVCFFSLINGGQGPFMMQRVGFPAAAARTSTK